MKWRDAIENGNYDPQSDEFPSRTPSPQKQKKMEVDGDTKRQDDTEDDDENNALLVVKDLSRALAQIAKCVESKYLGPPLGKLFCAKCGTACRELTALHLQNTFWTKL